MYCEGHFSCLDGKTAHGLVRHCDAFEIRAVIDSHCAGLDAGLMLDGVANGIPIVACMDQALALVGPGPASLIYGMAPASGLFSQEDRRILLEVMAAGLNLVSGMREFLNDDAEFKAQAERHGVSIRDVRRPAALRDLRLFSGSIARVRCPRIAVLVSTGQKA
ncbi:MAG: DUF1611 domain-containing protein [Synechococcaceae cyanobacterium]